MPDPTKYQADFDPRQALGSGGGSGGRIDPNNGLLKALINRLKAGEPLESIPRSVRQEAMGMTKDVYHGTYQKGVYGRDWRPPKEDYKYLKVNHGTDKDFGLHVDPDPVVAENASYGPSVRIFPLKARMEKTIDLPDLGRWNDPFHAMRKLPQTDYRITKEPWGWTENNTTSLTRGGVIDELRDSANMVTRGAYNTKEIGAAMEKWNDMFPQILNRHGVDSVRYLNSIEGNGGPSYMLLNSNQVRLPWANFDPRKFSAGDLLASLVGAGSLPLFMKSQAKQEDPLDK